MNEFVLKIKDGAMATQKKYGILASLTIAQAILETGWGKYSVGNNIFGIKANAAWTGDTITCNTGEVYDGQAVTVSGTFRAYASIEDSIADHALLFVRNDCYSNIINCTDYRQACRNVQADGYATDPEYADKLISIIEANNLTQFDSAPADAPQPTPEPEQPTEQQTYTVQSGDTMWGIAQAYGMSLDDLVALNPQISDPASIYPGDVINVSGSAPAEPEQTTSTYTVVQDDTLWGLAERFLGAGERYPEIKQLNGLGGDTIYPGQTLQIPQ